MKRFLLLLAFLPVLLFATENYPIKVVNNKRYYEYTVQAGDGLFAVARKFDVTQADIHQANPDLNDALRSGQVILIPVVEKEITHTVEPKQTLFAISKLYGVSIDELIRLNPNAANGIKVGDVLLIKEGSNASSVVAPVSKSSAASPAPVTPLKKVATVEKPVVDTSFIYHTVQRKETLYSISRQYSIPVEDIVSFNPFLSEGLKVGQKLRLPSSTTVAVPANAVAKAAPANNVVSEQLPALSTITPSKEQTALNVAPSSTLHVAVLLPFMTQTHNADGTADRFIEFYKGTLLAFESLKAEGKNIVVHTYDVGKDASGVDSVLRLPEFAANNLIIGPAYTPQVPLVSAYAFKHHVMTVVPFTSKIAAKDSHSYIYQFNPSHEMLFPIIADDVCKLGYTNYLFVDVPDANNKGTVFSQKMKSVVDAKKLSVSHFTIGRDSLNSLQQHLSHKKTMVIFNSSDIDDVLPVMNKLKDLNYANVSQFGYEDWKSYLVRFPNTYYFSLFHSMPTEHYSQQYERWFGKLHKIEVPRYDMLGYDLTYYFINGMHFQNNKWNFTAPKVYADLMQSEPHYLQVYDGLWMNLNYYLFNYDGYQTQLITTKY